MRRGPLHRRTVGLRRGLMVDLSMMKAISVDPQAQTASAAGGVLWGELDRATQAHGLATTGGNRQPHRHRRAHPRRRARSSHAQTRARRRQPPVGRPRHRGRRAPSRDRALRPGAVRGLRGGGNFGIATKFEYQLHPVGPMVLGGPIVWPLEDAAQVMTATRELAPNAPDELGISVALIPAPPGPFVPPERFGRPTMALVPVWAGDPSEGARAIEPLRRIGTPIADVVRPTPYAALQSLLDRGAPHGRHYDWKAHKLHTLSDDVIDVFLDAMGSATSPFAQINGWAVCGAVSRVAGDATSVGDRHEGRGS